MKKRRWAITKWTNDCLARRREGSEETNLLSTTQSAKESLVWLREFDSSNAGEALRRQIFIPREYRELLWAVHSIYGHIKSISKSFSTASKSFYSGHKVSFIFIELLNVVLLIYFKYILERCGENSVSCGKGHLEGEYTVERVIWTNPQEAESLLPLVTWRKM